MDYELEDAVAEQIIADVLKEYKIPKWKHKMFFTLCYKYVLFLFYLLKNINMEKRLLLMVLNMN